MKRSSLLPLLFLTLSLQAHAFTDGFVENRGQWPDEVRYRLQLDGLTMWITDRGAVYDLHQRVVEAFTLPHFELFEQPSDRLMPKRDEISHVRGHVLRSEFVDVSPDVEAIGGERMSGRVNYFIGDDTTRWSRNCPIYSSVRLKGVYEGIDAVYYLDGGLPRYDLEIAPGADPAQVRMAIEGADDARLLSTGRVAVGTSLGDLEMREPTTYDENGMGEGCPVTWRFHVENGVLAFSVDSDYRSRADRSTRLVVDPLIYSTFINGVHDASRNGLAVDSEGNAYVSGGTLNTTGGFPVTTGAYVTPAAGLLDLYVMKLNADGSGLIFAAVFGSSSDDFVRGIAVDSLGFLHIAGEAGTNADGVSDFPTTEGAYQRLNVGEEDAFVVKLDSSGSFLRFSTLIGSEERETVTDIAVDRRGDVYLLGWTSSRFGCRPEFPTTDSAYLRTGAGGRDIYITKFDPTGSMLIASTLFGGASSEYGHAFAIDSDDAVYITGWVDSTDPLDGGFPRTAGAYDRSFSSQGDVFVAKMNRSLSALHYSTLIGGVASEGANDIRIDTSGCAIIVGTTYESAAAPRDRYPTTPGAYITEQQGDWDVFVTKLDPTGSTLLFSTLLGGLLREMGPTLSLDGTSGRIWVAGSTGASPDSLIAFPTTSDAMHHELRGVWDGFISVLTPDGDDLIYSTLIGGDGEERIFSSVLDGAGAFYLSGVSFALPPPARSYPTTAGAYNPVPSGDNFVAFVSKLSLDLSAVSITADERPMWIDLR